MRKEFTHNHEMYHGEYLHGLAIAVNTIPDRCLSFQVVFTGVKLQRLDEGDHLSEVVLVPHEQKEETDKINLGKEN